MLNIRWKPILWSGVFIVIMLSIFTPLSIITVSLIMVPLVIMYVILGLRAFLIYYAVCSGVILLLTGFVNGFSLILISLFFLGPAMVMGYLYRKEKAAHMVIAAGVGAIIASMLFTFLAAALANNNLIGAITSFIEESYYNVPAFMGPSIPEEIIDQTIIIMTQLIPLYMIMISVFYAMITHWLGRKLLIRTGYPIEGLPPIKEWVLPKAIVWYYVIGLVLSYTIEPGSNSMIAMIVLNLVPLLMFAFCVQAVSFLFFLAEIKGWNRLLPILGIIASLFIPQIISLLGVFDVSFQIRNKIQNKKL